MLWTIFVHADLMRAWIGHDFHASRFIYVFLAAATSGCAVGLVSAAKSLPKVDRRKTSGLTVKSQTDNGSAPRRPDGYAAGSFSVDGNRVSGKVTAASKASGASFPDNGQ